MTLEELHQKLALDMLIKTGIGLVSPKTYDEICAICVPEQRVEQNFTGITVHGIRLIKNPFIPDGQIYPFEKWDLRPERKREFPLCP